MREHERQFEQKSERIGHLAAIKVCLSSNANSLNRSRYIAILRAVRRKILY